MSLIVIIISITIIIISIITSIIAIIITSTKNDIWDMEKLFHKLTNFREQTSPRDGASIPDAHSLVHNIGALIFGNKYLHFFLL